MRISDWSSDVCSSDLLAARQALSLELGVRGHALAARQADAAQIWSDEICPRRRARDGDRGRPFRPLRHQLRPDPRDRKSTRLNSVTNAHLVCRLLLEKKKKHLRRKLTLRTQIINELTE